MSEEKAFSTATIIVLVGLGLFGFVLLVCGALLYNASGLGLVVFAQFLLAFGFIFVLGALLYVAIKLLVTARKERATIEERQGVLRQVIQRYSSIYLDELTKLLSFSSRTALQKWILTLPAELAFVIEDDKLVIAREKFIGEEAEQAIDQLLQSFADFEEKGTGKV